MAHTTNADDLNVNNAGNESENELKDKEILKKKLATEFPLSGGETESEWSIAIGDVTGEDDTVEEKKEFKRTLNTEFPLSGGEA